MVDQHESRFDEQLALLLRVNTLRQQGAFLEAITLCREGIEGPGGTPDLLALVAECYYALALSNPMETGENYQSAIDWMTKASAARPDEARFHASLAEYYWLGSLDYERAAQEFRKAILLAPNRVATFRGAVALYGVPENVVTLEEATGWLERAARLEPDDPNLHAHLGELYLQAGRLPEAKLAWRRALLCPKPPDPGYTRSIRLDNGT